MRIDYTPTRDFAAIREVLTHPRLYGWLTDDFSPAREEFAPCKAECIRYIAVHAGGEPAGLFVFVPHSPVLWEVHTCLLPHAWGETARAAACGMSEWIWANTDCRRIVTTVPAYNRLALRFALAAGMTEYGRNPRAYQKRGKLHDLILLGIGPKETSPCQQ